MTPTTANGEVPGNVEFDEIVRVIGFESPKRDAGLALRRIDLAMAMQDVGDRADCRDRSRQRWFVLLELGVQFPPPRLGPQSSR